MFKLLTAPLFIVLLILLYFTFTVRFGARLRLGLLCLTVLLTALSMPAVTARLATPLETRYPYPSAEELALVDVIAVLSSNVHYGAGNNQTELDQASYLRTTVGARAFLMAEPRWLVFQGTLGGGEPELMVQTMGKLAAAWGVPPHRIRYEARSRNTREHPHELLRMDGIAREDVIGVVTSAWHLPRAVREFERHFDRVVPIPADYISKQITGTARDWFPQVTALADSTQIVHERIGRLWYDVRAWALGGHLGVHDVD